MTSTCLTVRSVPQAQLGFPTLQRALLQAHQSHSTAPSENINRSFLSPPKGKEAERYATWQQLGLSMMQERCYANALAYFNRAIALAPLNAEAWYNRGNALANLERFEEALACFDKALSLDPSDHESWTFRGVVLIQLDRVEEALASCETALKLQPNDSEALIFRGTALQRLGHYRAAYASFDSALGIQRQSFWNKVRNWVSPLADSVKRFARGRC